MWTITIIIHSPMICNILFLTNMQKQLSVGQLIPLLLNEWFTLKNHCRIILNWIAPHVNPSRNKFSATCPEPACPELRRGSRRAYPEPVYTEQNRSRLKAFIVSSVYLSRRSRSFGWLNQPQPCSPTLSSNSYPDRLSSPTDCSESTVFRSRTSAGYLLSARADSRCSDCRKSDAFFIHFLPSYWILHNKHNK